MIDTITKLAPPRLAATAISIMATLVWVIGKGVRLVQLIMQMIRMIIHGDRQGGEIILI